MATPLEALIEGMDSQRPACRGDDRFTLDAEHVSSDDLAAMGALCPRCPLRTLCKAYATKAKPTGGYWAGRHYPARKARS